MYTQCNDATLAADEHSVKLLLREKVTWLNAEFIFPRTKVLKDREGKNADSSKYQNYKALACCCTLLGPEISLVNLLISEHIPHRSLVA